MQYSTYLISISFSESHAKWLLCSSEVFSACWQHFDKSLWYKIVPRCDKILPATRIFRTRKSNARPQFTLRDFYTRKRNCAAFERCQGDYGETKFSIRIKYYCMIWAKLISVIVYSAWRTVWSGRFKQNVMLRPKDYHSMKGYPI